MDNLVRMTAAIHPFKAETKDLSLPEGLTVNQMLAIAQPDRKQVEHAIVFIKGEVILKEEWDKYRPKRGELVEVRAFPIPRGGDGDGGKNPLRIILTIAVIAFAAWAGPALAGMFFSSAAIEAGGAWVTFSIAALKGISAAAGMLLVNAVAPIRPATFDALSGTGGTDSPTLYIEGARNALRPFSPVPVVLGKYRMTPPLGAKPYTEVIGDKQYIRMLFIWGVGPLSIDTDSLKIGETLLSEFEGYQIEHREGYDDDEPLTLFPSVINQDDFSVLLTSAAGWVSRTSDDDSDELGIDFTFPNGLIQYDANGNRAARAVNVEIQYRKVGDSAWSDIDTSGSKFESTIPDSWLNKSGDDLSSITFNQNKTASIRHGMRWGVSESGQYDIRIRRITADTDSTQIYDSTVWTALRSITNEDPVNTPYPVAKTALVIQATDQLNGIIDEFNGIVTTVAKDWDSGSGTWIEQETQNPASLFRHALQGKGIAEPLADARIDLDTLEDWHESNVTRGFQFNMIRDFAASAWDTLADISSAGRAAPTQIDGKWSVVVEEEKSAPVSFITSRNSFDFKAEKTFLDLPHGWRIRFPNEDEGYGFDERRVYRDGYSDSNATKFESIELPGVTDPDQIFKLGRFRIAQAANQPERWRFKQDMEYLTYKRGQRVAITHDVLLVGQKSGRIKSVTLDGADVTDVTLDEEITMLEGSTYGIVIRTIYNSSLSVQVVTNPGTTKELTLSSAVPGVGSPAQAAISAGNIFGFGLFGQETDDASIISIVPDTNFRAQITAIPYRAAIFAADSEEIPEFTTNMTPLTSIPAPSIRNVISDESAMAIGAGDTLRIRIGINFDPLNKEVFGAEPKVKVQIRPSDTGEPFSPAVVDSETQNHVFISDVRTGETWDIRMRFEVEGRFPGPWAYVYSHQVVGKSSAPSPLSNMTISVFGGQALIRWDKPSELDVIFGGEVVFRHNPSQTSPSWAESYTIGQAARARTLYAILPLKAGSYMARVYDVVGNPSDEVTVVSTKQASVHEFSSVDTIDEASSSPAFSGTHDDTTVSDSKLKIDDSLSPAIFEGTYNFAQGIDLGSVQRVRLTTRLGVVVYDVSETMDDRSDNVDDWEDFDNILQAGADARVYVRHTDGDPEASPVSWSDWERLDSAEFECRAFQFYVKLSRDSVDYNILVDELGVDVESVV